jgi:pSer/pThr/pTyr-binding forkhead associated (FHA) protein
MPKECNCCGSAARPGNHYCTRCGVALERGEPPRAALALLRGRRQWARRVITNRVVQIGRGEFCEILLNDPLVSEKHARVVYSNGSFWVEDAGSRNGTFVNGRRIERRSILQDGYLLRVGSSMFRFEQEAAERNSGT